MPCGWRTTWSRIEPATFYKVVFALKDAIEKVGDSGAPDGEDAAPGLRGAYAMLNDDDLWRGLKPLMTGLKTFAEGLERDSGKPITAFTGKETSA